MAETRYPDLYAGVVTDELLALVRDVHSEVSYDFQEVLWLLQGRFYGGTTGGLWAVGYFAIGAVVVEAIQGDRRRM